MSDFQHLPLPQGVARSGYFHGMREVVAYDINTDRYPVRYDWLDADGQKHSFIAEPIEATDAFGRHDLTGELAVRRIACLKHRGIE